MLASTARADTITLGLFAPTAPFPSTAERVAVASKLGDELGKALGGTGVGKVYARAADFAAAAKHGELQLALVDASYLAVAGGALGSYTVLGEATRGGDARGWQLVARGASKIGALRGKRVLVPGIGGRETDFVLDVLLAGEVARDFFAKIEPAPDTASVLAALGLGKADAAVVPGGVELPAGTAAIVQLPVVAGPVLIAFGSVSAAQRSALVSAMHEFHGDATVGGFRDASADAVRAIASRLAPPVKRGPLAVPAIRLLVGDLVEGRTFAIERTPAAAFAVAPERR